MHLLTLILTVAALVAASAAMAGSRADRRTALQPARIRRQRPPRF